MRRASVRVMAALLPGLTACWLLGVSPAVGTAQPQAPSLPSEDSAQRWTVRNALPGVAFQNPVFAIMPPRAPSRWFVGEREGRILAVDNSEAADATTTILDLRDRTLGWQDVGLLNLAFHPEFGAPGSPNAGFFFVWYNYTRKPHPGPAYPPFNTPSRTRLSRFTMAAGGRAADPASELVLLEQPRTNTNHMGGGMFFHPKDGFLYLAIGDGGHDLLASGLGHGYAMRPVDAPQRLDADLLSGVVRLDVDRRGGDISHPIRRQPRTGRSAGYFVPNDNPWVGAGGEVLEEFFALGLRSPHRMSYDSSTDRIFAGDVGDVSFEEINVIERGGNYQWSFKEGTRWLRPRPARLIGVEKPPLFSYPHVGFSAVIGGAVYRGSAHPSLAGKYLFADNGSGQIFALDADSKGGSAPQPVLRLPREMTGYGGLSSFAFDAVGEIYLCILGQNQQASGSIQRLIARKTTHDDLPRTLSATGLFQDVRSLRPTDHLFAYQVNVPFWSDHADKRRWIHVPRGRHIRFHEQEDWTFPPGTVAVKHFDLALDERDPRVKRRLETRVMVMAAGGGAYGRVYRWRADQSDADLLSDEVTEHITAIAREPFGPLAPASLPDLTYSHTPAAGDFDVAVLWNVKDGGEAGIMLRQGLGRTAPYLFVSQERRADTGETTLMVESVLRAGDRPVRLRAAASGPWLRLRRTGEDLSLFSGADGHLWTAAAVAMPPSKHGLVGPAARARGDAGTATLARSFRCLSRDHLYPGPDTCLACHNANSHYLLGLNTRQWNREVGAEGGAAANQLVLASQRGLFDRTIAAAATEGYPRLRGPDDRSATLQDRARSFLDANCAACHRPGGVVQVTFDARSTVALSRQGLIWGPTRWPVLAPPDEFIVAPRDLSRSRLYRRLARGDMPPVGGLHKNAGGLALIKEWIQSLEGTPALEAVEISASAGHRDRQSVMVELRHGDPEAELHYTTTDTPPDRNSTRYEGPFLVTRPAVVRAIAYKQGMRWSRPSSLELFYLGSQSQAPAPARRPGGR